MKTSKIILLFTALCVIVVLVIFARILHDAIQTKRASVETGITFRTHPTGEFSSLILSDNVKVRIRQGKNCGVEYAVSSDAVKPVMNNINGTLSISADSAPGSTVIPLVKITMPRVLEISAGKGSEIRMGFFTTDSIRIMLGEGCIFNGNDNTLKKVTFITSGNAQINISSTF